MTGGRTCVRAAVCVAGSRGSSVAALVDGLRRSLSLAREFLFWRWGREHGDGMGCVCGGKREGGEGDGRAWDVMWTACLLVAGSRVAVRCS